jgi:hypothetical protein
MCPLKAVRVVRKASGTSQDPGMALHCGFAASGSQAQIPLSGQLYFENIMSIGK